MQTKIIDNQHLGRLVLEMDATGCARICRSDDMRGGVYLNRDEINKLFLFLTGNADLWIHSTREPSRDME